MGGRNPMPMDVQSKIGKKHLTIQEKEERTKSENKIPKLNLEELKKIKAPLKILNDVKSYEYWKLQIQHYIKASESGIDILAMSDIDFFTEYCIISSRLDKINKKLNDMYSCDGDVLNIDDLNKFELISNRLLKTKISLTEKLFLNPLARMRNVPIKDIVKEKTDEERMFDI